MTIRDGLIRVLTEYRAATREAFTRHPLAHFLRHDLPQSMSTISGHKDRLQFKGSAGQGIWAKGPWIAILDPVVTESAQRGYYPGYLFREDMSGLYLSLNQGMTEAKNNYKSDAKTALRARAGNFRALLGDRIRRFPSLEIDLRADSPGNDTSFYEAGNVCSTLYDTSDLPSEAVLIDDLNSMIDLYQALVIGETDSEAATIQQEDDSPPGLDFEDASRFRMHKRIERRRSLAEKVKRLKGLTCEVCETTFESVYGPIGAGYIEAHHKMPLASLSGTKVSLDPIADFAVLCANCHRMIHRSGLVGDIEKFRKEHFRTRR